MMQGFLLRCAQTAELRADTAATSKFCETKPICDQVTEEPLRGQPGARPPTICISPLQGLAALGVPGGYLY